MNFDYLVGTLTIGETMFNMFILLFVWTMAVDIVKLILKAIYKLFDKILDFVADLIVKCIKSIIAKFRKLK